MGNCLARDKGRLQQREERQNSFGAVKRRKFLDALALTCNFTTSARHADVALGTVHRVRRHDPAFAEQVLAALEIGCLHLEALLLEHGGAAVPIEPDPARAQAEGCVPPPFDFDRALKVLTYRRATLAREPSRRTGCPVRNATREETNAVLMRALAAVEKRLAKERAKVGRA